MGSLIGGSRRDIHTSLPTVSPTHTPIILHIAQKAPAVDLPNLSIPSVVDEPHAVATAGTTMPYHHLDCPHGELLTFWQRTTEADQKYESPYLHTGPAVKYVTFEPGIM